jgi:hypothetical protein
MISSVVSLVKKLFVFSMIVSWTVSSVAFVTDVCAA